MISAKDKILCLTERWGLTRDELKEIARQVYLDRTVYGQRPVKTDNSAVFAINLLFYNQWMAGPYIRELRRRREKPAPLPWYKCIFGGFSQWG